jgi:HK97 family phage prohead protease
VKLDLAVSNVKHERRRLRIAQRRGDRIEAADAKLCLDSAVNAMKTLIATRPFPVPSTRTRRALRVRRTGLALRSEYRGGREQRVRISSASEKRKRRSGLEFRSSGSGLKSYEVEISGQASRYERFYDVSDKFGSFRERVMRGAAKDVLARGADIRLLIDHQGMALARTTTETLKVTEDDLGLNFTAVIDRRQRLANDLAIAVERGDMRECSIGFVVGSDEWSHDWSTRSILSFAELLDVSVVGFPANSATSVSITGGGRAA